MALGDRQRAHNVNQANLRFEQTNVDMRAAAQRAAAANPGINPAIFNDIANQTIHANHEYRDNAIPGGRPSSGAPPIDPRYIQMQNGRMRQQQMQSVHQDIRNRYGEEGELAWRAMSKETTRPGLFTSLIKNFYDSDKGGLQVGGIVGALAGLAGAFFLTGGGGEGGWLGIAAMVIAPIAGAVLGNRLMASMDSGSNSGPTFPGQGQVPTRGQGPSQNQQPASNVSLNGANVAPGITGGSNIPNNNSGQLPPQVPGGGAATNSPQPGFAMPPSGTGR